MLINWLDLQLLDTPFRLTLLKFSDNSNHSEYQSHDTSYSSIDFCAIAGMEYW